VNVPPLSIEKVYAIFNRGLKAWLKAVAKS